MKTCTMLIIMVVDLPYLKEEKMRENKKLSF